LIITLNTVKTVFFFINFNDLNIILLLCLKEILIYLNYFNLYIHCSVLMISYSLLLHFDLFFNDKRARTDNVLTKFKLF